MMTKGSTWSTLLSTSDGSELTLSTFSGNPRMAKWSFSKADRFRQPKKFQKRGHSCPSTADASTAAPSGAPTPAVLEEDASESGHSSPSMQVGAHKTSGKDTTMSYHMDGFGLTVGEAYLGYGRGGSSVARPDGHKWVVGSAPRLDGGLDRMLEPPERSCAPRPQQYDAAIVFGEDTISAYHRAPNYSVGGGKSRMADLEPRAQTLSGLAQESAKAAAAKAQKMHKSCPNLRTPVKTTLSRGFGTEPRLKIRGGALQLPFSPGPAGYDVVRDSDIEPLWASKSVLPWGNRTGGRSEFARKLECRSGPGDHVAQYGMFNPAKPHPVFAHPLRTLTKDNFPAAGKYEIATSIGTGTGIKIGNAPQRDARPPPDNPGPGNYDPEDVHHRAACARFGTSERTHEADLIDPDEPPGPGAHDLLRDPRPKECLNPGLPKDAKLKKTTGLGPQGFPGPGQYRCELPTGKAIALHYPLKRPLEKTPGPADYRVSVRLTKEEAPAWGSVGRTAPRKPPWETNNAGSDDMAVAVMAAEAAAANQEGDLPQASKSDFKPKGPKWSLGRRRETKVDRSGVTDSFYGPHTSLGFA